MVLGSGIMVDGFLASRLNTHTSISSYVFLIVWLCPLSRCNITFAIWAAKT